MSLPGTGVKLENAAQWQAENTIFALDIGTRTVIGIVAGIEGESLRILAQSITEHQSRAVYDGQIHDIFKTAQAVKRVKTDLEEKVGFRLDKVSIAAAGRSLKTRSAHVEQEIGDDIEIDTVICKGLEMEAVKEAHRNLQEEMKERQDGMQFFCVGYTVVGYYLNGYTMTSLVGHYGKTIAVDVLATFLPNSVVNSLYAVLGRVNLEPVSLTLEPIAAASAIIPDSYRLLNLALLDIGAGTSDIAITRDGTIVAYGMVPLAGDEMTEALSHGCLADFHTADRVKRELLKGKEITFQDVMGAERTISCEQAMSILEPALDDITDKISKEIVRLNGNKPPKSVICVGGGGQVPTFTEKIAQKLGLSPERVGLRTRKSIPDLLAADEEISGPEGVTVVGIAKVAQDKEVHNFITVTINDTDYKLFHSRELTVFDALGLIEYNLADLVGKNGKDLRFILNGERKVVYGGLCKPAEVFINGDPANLKTGLQDGDRVNIQKAVMGEDARATVADYVEPDFELMLRIDGQLERVLPQCLVNGRPANVDLEIAEGDRVEIYEVKNVLQLAQVKGIDLFERGVFVNGQRVFSEKALTCGDSVDFGDLENEEDLGESEEVEETIEPLSNLGPCTVVEVTVNNEKVVLTDKPSYIFIDIFNHIDVDSLRPSPGSKIKLLINGCSAGYTDPINDGDVIEVGCC